MTRRELWYTFQRAARDVTLVVGVAYVLWSLHDGVSGRFIVDWARP